MKKENEMLTCNQMIALLDIRRGFDRSRHLGTIESDLRVLRGLGLVQGSDSDFEWELTALGNAKVDRLLTPDAG